MDIKKLTINSTSTIKEALLTLNNSGVGTLFVVNNERILIGIITDGDIRRALLAGITIEEKVGEAMNRDFISLPIDTDNSIILASLSTKVKIIPLTNAENLLVDYASINKIRRISIAEPLLDGNEFTYVADCIRTSWISSQGKYVKQFEDVFSAYHMEFKSLAVSNGTVALHLALDALGIGKGDEVLVADLTFAASVNAIIYTGATPLLIDIEPDTWNIDIKKAIPKISSKTKAIMVVHLYGHPCDMDAVMNFAQENNLLVIEDCAEALGSFYKGQPVGTFGDVATFSFYGNKTITTGEGGMILFKDNSVGEHAAVLRDHGMDKGKRYWHVHVGYNYRLTNIQAAIGVAQFERLEEFIAAKRRLATGYNKTLKKHADYFTIPAERNDCINSYWLYTFLVKNTAPFTREELMDYLNKHGIETRPVFYPMHIMPPYTSFGNSKDLEVSKMVSVQGMSLPSSVTLTETDQIYICKCINEFLDKIKN